MQRGIEGALLDLQHVFGDLLDPLGDGPAVLGFEGDGFEDEEVEGALRQGEFFWRHGLPLWLLQGEDSLVVVEAKGEREGLFGEWNRGLRLRLPLVKGGKSGGKSAALQKRRGGCAGGSLTVCGDMGGC